ncbi:hypothetical protein M2138_000851 [Dysgonomonadaceae bacterium PH5-43]|nr:hypothetical protein [Dysgonomonadaceae bacterium PH5-43]
MQYKTEIDECLKILHSLENAFECMLQEQVLPLSFFSESHDKIYKLKDQLNKLEEKQFREREEEKKRELEMLNQDNDLPEECMPPKEYVVETTIEEVLESIEELPKEEVSEEIAESSVEFLGDKIGKKLFATIQSSLTFNDKFRFQRDLFSGNSELMNETMNYLNNIESKTEALDYLKEYFSWDWESESVVAFKEILDKRFI